jgi:hypothetical protein
MKIKTDYMKVKTIVQFVAGLEDARDILRKEAEDGNLYSGLQADVIDPILATLKRILSGEAGR